MNPVLVSSKKMDWETPKKFFEALDQEFHFVLDAAATEKNAKCDKYFTPEQDGLKQSWNVGGSVYCNPPYGRNTGKWVQKAWEEAQNGVTIVLLIPARTDTKYFHKYIFGHAKVVFLPGRLCFETEGKPMIDAKGRAAIAPFPSALVIYNAGNDCSHYIYE